MMHQDAEEIGQRCLALLEVWHVASVQHVMVGATEQYRATVRGLRKIIRKGRISTGVASGTAKTVRLALVRCEDDARALLAEGYGEETD